MVCIKYYMSRKGENHVECKDIAIGQIIYALPSWIN